MHFIQEHFQKRFTRTSAALWWATFSSPPCSRKCDGYFSEQGRREHRRHITYSKKKISGAFFPSPRGEKYMGYVASKSNEVPAMRGIPEGNDIADI